MLSMDIIAEIRRRHFISGESISSIARSLQLSRPTVRKHLRTEREIVAEMISATILFCWLYQCASAHINALGNTGVCMPGAINALVHRSSTNFQIDEHSRSH